MADGLGSRWFDGRSNPPPYKQLLPINKIPLIERTYNQVKSYDVDNIYLICPGTFAHYLSEGLPMQSLGYKEGKARPILDGILKTQLLWSDRTIVLLGDVCFSNSAINLLLTSGMDYFILGRKGENKISGKRAGELFALSFFEDRQSEVVKQLISVLNSGGKKLWDLYNAFPITLYETCDSTDDTDSPEAYLQFWPAIKSSAMRDDERWNER